MLFPAQPRGPLAGSFPTLAIHLRPLRVGSDVAITGEGLDDLNEGQQPLSLICISADDVVRRSFALSAKRSGFFDPIHSFADGRFSLEYIWDRISTGNVPAVVLTDLRVKSLTGLQLLREMNRYEELKPVFRAVVTSVGGAREQDAAETAGADFVLRYASADWPSVVTLRQIAQRALAKALPAFVNASRLCCGTLGGVGIEIPHLLSATPHSANAREPTLVEISN
jgi:hypothetical protein